MSSSTERTASMDPTVRNSSLTRSTSVVWPACDLILHLPRPRVAVTYPRPVTVPVGGRSASPGCRRHYCTRDGGVAQTNRHIPGRTMTEGSARHRRLTWDAHSPQVESLTIRARRLRGRHIRGCLRRVADVGTTTGVADCAVDAIYSKLGR